MMDSILDFDDIFSDIHPGKHERPGSMQGSVYSRVPDAPKLTVVPDLNVLLGSGDDPLSFLPSSQWLPTLSQKYSSKDAETVPEVKAVQASDDRFEDDDDIYLGSQFPLVHKVPASQASRRLAYNPSEESGGIASQKSKQTMGKAGNSAVVLPYKPTGGQNRKDTTAGRCFQTPYMRNTSALSEMEQVQPAPRDQLWTPAAIILPQNHPRSGMSLRSVTEIPAPYRQLFNFKYFNLVQSKVFDDVVYTDKPLVLCSPTGSGKTAVFEMAIVRLLNHTQNMFRSSFKIVYMAPIKALCSERYKDWQMKLEPLGLRVMELTGDTDTEDFYELQQVNVILTTPEKWDSMTRRWRDNKAVMQAICLFLIDEIHILNDTTRGATVEAVLSRMKTIQAARCRAKTNQEFPPFRFIAVSATITNIEDIAEWLSSGKTKAVYYKMNDSVRPVRLRKVVLGYTYLESKQSDFQFDLNLSYKLAGIINTYSEEKPTLVFCSTRKSTMQGADILAKDVKSSYVRSHQHRQQLANLACHIKDTKLRDLVSQGIGYHHAGMDIQDRKNMEEVFSSGDLPVLVATSTLAMGVNLPAHLVIVKSTMYYNMGCHQQYPDTQVLQMIGRAGRPQFDTSATAVIMTKNQSKMHYDNLMNGSQLIESSLHKNLVEHLNAEIVLRTISDISVAVEWLKYTFLYIRVMKNPTHYGMPHGLSKSSIEKRLQEMCVTSLNQLAALGLIQMNEEDMDIKPTESGRLMARYCVSFKTAELFLGIKDTETIEDLLNTVSKCEEFADIQLRINEKKTLNTLNKDKNRATIRFPMTGKIKTTEMKVNCLIQASLGNLSVQDFSLQQDTSRIFRAGTRITRCLVELLSQRNEFKSMLRALQLCKCFKAKLWENSKYVSKQLDGIGPSLSTALVNAGLTTFQKMETTNAREIELIVNRHPPFGNQVRESVAQLPKYELMIEQVTRYSKTTAEILVSVQLTNGDELRDRPPTGHCCTLLVGDQDNKIVYKQRAMDALLLKEHTWTKRLTVTQAEKGPQLFIHYISQDYVGIDIECLYTPNYLGSTRISSSAAARESATTTDKKALSSVQPCNHSCLDKKRCRHDCCKDGVGLKRKQSRPAHTAKLTAPSKTAGCINEMRLKAAKLPTTPSTNKRARLQIQNGMSRTGSMDLSQFAYNRHKSQNIPDKDSDNNGHDALLDGHSFESGHRPNQNHQYSQRPYRNYQQPDNQYQLSCQQHQQPYRSLQPSNWEQHQQSAQYCPQVKQLQQQPCHKPKQFNQQQNHMPDDQCQLTLQQLQQHPLTVQRKQQQQPQPQDDDLYIFNTNQGLCIDNGYFTDSLYEEDAAHQLDDISRMSTKYTIKKTDSRCKQKYTPGSAKRPTYWPELDMYQKHRENLAIDTADIKPECEKPEDGVSLDSQDLRDPGAGWSGNDTEVPIHIWDEDIVQETDYGLTYICDKDKADPEQDRVNSGKLHQLNGRDREDWDDDRVVSQKQQRGRDRRVQNFKRKVSVTNHADSVSESLPGQSHKASMGASAMFHAKYFPSKEAQQHPALIEQIDDSPEIVDISEESFEEDLKLDVQGRRRVDKRFNQSSAKPDQNRVLVRSNFTYGSQPGQTAIGCSEDFYKEDGEGKCDSKWTNYFSSQSSTASECLNWRYPVTHGNKKVVMEKYGHREAEMAKTSLMTEWNDLGELNRTKRDQVIGTIEHLPDNKGDGERGGLSRHSGHGDVERGVKYGQVLAWVSNSQPGESSAEAREGERTRKGPVMQSGIDVGGQSSSNRSCKALQHMSDLHSAQLSSSVHATKSNGAKTYMRDITRSKDISKDVLKGETNLDSIFDGIF